MEFIKALKNIVNKQKRRVGTRAYYDRGEVYFSRIFGYKLENGKYEPDIKYESTIKTIFSMLVDGKSLPEVKQVLDKTGARDSSNNKYGISKIISLVRPIYAGYIEQRGRLVQVSNLTPIVTLDDYRRSAKKIKAEKRKLTDQ